MIGVASVSVRGLPPRYDHGDSVRNNSILVAAPGNSVQVTADWQIDGPGAAAAWVTGAVALIKSLYPHLSPALVARALAMTARYRPHGGYDTTTGFGIIDPHGALLAASQLTAITATARPGTGGAVDAAGYFGAGPVTGTIDAARYSGVLLGAWSALIAAGIAMLICALARRRRPGGTRRKLALG